MYFVLSSIDIRSSIQFWVLFALKVLVNTYFPNENQRIFGWFPIPPKYACWAELILIQLLTPNVSFVGHLAGILVGLMYTSGPLKLVTDMICAVIDPASGFGGRNAGVGPSAPPESDDDDDYISRIQNYPGAFSGRGATLGGGANRDDYNAYTGGLSEEEQIRRAMRESMHDASIRQRRYGWNID